MEVNYLGTCHNRAAPLLFVNDLWQSKPKAEITYLPEGHVLTIKSHPHPNFLLLSNPLSNKIVFLTHSTFLKLKYIYTIMCTRKETA